MPQYRHVRLARWTSAVALGLSLTLLVGCQKDTLVGVQNRLRLDPASLVFEPAFADGRAHVKSFTVINDGTATLSATPRCRPSFRRGLRTSR
jgi:hypothetical protein